MGNVHTRLTSTKNDNLAALRKLISLLELGRVLDNLHLVDARNIRDIGCNMKAAADSDSITFPSLVNAVRSTVMNDVTTGLTSPDGGDRR